MFFQGHPEAAIENITLTDISVTFAGGGTAQQAERREMIDMDNVDYRNGGYWTDDKNLWGVPPAYGLYARHLKGLSLSNIAFSLAKADLRSPLFCFDSSDISISEFHADCASGTAIVTARNCSDVKLSGIQPQTKTVILRLEGEKSNDVEIFDNESRRYTQLFECLDGANADAIVSK
jgi:hypothetical protein